MRPDWPDVNENIRVGIVPGGSGQLNEFEAIMILICRSGHAVHCSLLHHQREKFSSELEVSALSLAHDNKLHHDILECQTRNKETLTLIIILLFRILITPST